MPSKLSLASFKKHEIGKPLSEFLDKLNAVKGEDEYSLEMLSAITDGDNNCHFEY